MNIRFLKYLLTSALIFLSLYPACSVADDSKNESARWDFIREYYEIRDSKVIAKFHKQLNILSARGDEYAKLWFLENTFVKIKKLQIKMKDIGGKVLKTYELKDLKKLCGYGASYAVYDDDCNYQFSITAPAHPYIVEVYQEEEYASPFNLRGAVLPTKIPITSVLCSLVYPQEIPVRHKFYALPLNVNESIVKNNRVIVWFADSVEPPDFDTLNALDNELAGHISIVVDDFRFINSAYKGGTWADIGRWYAEILKNRYAWEQLKPIALLTDDTSEYCRKAYDDVINDYRYVSISIGVGGWQPRLFDDIIKTKYGDCKDLAMLLLSELRSKNVETYPALILTRGVGILDTAFPNFGFNHLITASISNGDTVWMDPTCRNCPLGQIPWTDQNTYALIITDTAGILVRTPNSTAADNRAVRHVNARIDANGRLLAEMSFEYTGQRASNLRESFSHLTGEGLADFVESILESKSAAYTVKNYSIENLNDIYRPFRLNISAQSINPIKKVGQVFYIDPCLVEPVIGVTSSEYERVRPIKFSYPRTTIDSVRLVFDSGLTIDSIVLPAALEYSSDLGSCNISSVVANSDAQNEIVLTITYALDEITIQPGQFEELKKFSAIVESRDKRLVKVFTR